jgi:hypothetical protein
MPEGRSAACQSDGETTFGDTSRVAAFGGTTYGVPPYTCLSCCNLSWLVFALTVIFKSWTIHWFIEIG